MSNWWNYKKKLIELYFVEGSDQLSGLASINTTKTTNKGLLCLSIVKSDNISKKKKVCNIQMTLYKTKSETDVGGGVGGFLGDEAGT